MPDTPGVDDSAAYLVPNDGPDAWSAATADGGGTQRILAVETVVPPQRVVDALQLGATERAVVRRRLMLLDGRPVEIAESYFPARIATGTPLADAKKIRGGAPAVLAGLGFTAAYADEAVELETPPTSAEAALLQISADEPVARLFRTAYTAGGMPFEVATGPMLRTGRILHHRIVIDQES